MKEAKFDIREAQQSSIRFRILTAEWMAKNELLQLEMRALVQRVEDCYRLAKEGKSTYEDAMSLCNSQAERVRMFEDVIENKSPAGQELRKRLRNKP